MTGEKNVKLLDMIFKYFGYVGPSRSSGLEVGLVTWVRILVIWIISRVVNML